MNICLLGYMGSGKSTIGEILSKTLNLPFFDLDFVIEAQENQSISEIFKAKGEIQFRKLEHLTLQNLLKENNNAIISLGGGTPVYHNNIDLIHQNSYSIYLQATVATLSERLIAEKDTRPLIAHLKEEDVVEFIAKHLFERNHFYLQAHYKISVDQKKEKEIADEIILHFHHHNLL